MTTLMSGCLPLVTEERYRLLLVGEVGVRGARFAPSPTRGFVDVQVHWPNGGVPVPAQSVLRTARRGSGGAAQLDGLADGVAERGDVTGLGQPPDARVVNDLDRPTG